MILSDLGLGDDHFKYRYVIVGYATYWRTRAGKEVGTSLLYNGSKLIKGHHYEGYFSPQKFSKAINVQLRWFCRSIEVFKFEITESPLILFQSELVSKWMQKQTYKHFSFNKSDDFKDKLRIYDSLFEPEYSFWNPKPPNELKQSVMERSNKLKEEVISNG